MVPSKNKNKLVGAHREARLELCAMFNHQKWLVKKSPGPFRQAIKQLKAYFLLHFDRGETLEESIKRCYYAYDKVDWPDRERWNLCKCAILDTLGGICSRYGISIDVR